MGCYSVEGWVALVRGEGDSARTRLHSHDGGQADTALYTGRGAVI
jgi:hypothetical protein